MLLLALLVVILSSCDTSEPSSAEEDAGMEPAPAAPRSAPSEDGQKGGNGQLRLAMTPRTPDPRV